MPRLEESTFQRAFVAVSYLAGRRGQELLEPLKLTNRDTQKLVQLLGHPERERRAEVLAAELSPLAHSLELRSLR